MLKCLKIVYILVIAITGLVKCADINRPITNKDDLILAQTVCNS